MLGDLSLDVLLGRMLVIILGIPIHEWAHCWVASLLGDETPGMEGRLTLNPLAHLDPIGTLMILMTGFGWGKAARVNPYGMRRVSNPRMGMALTALAGPLSNVIQAMILAIPIRLILRGWLPVNLDEWMWNVLVAAISVNVGLATFNLLPFPPLDGSRILAGIAPGPIAGFIESLEPYAGMILMAVLFILPQMGFNLVVWMVTPIQEFVFNALFYW